MSTEHNVVVTRVLDAPVEPVWRAWSESEQMMRWWGPTGFTCPVARMDVREGGTSPVCMRSPDGHDIYNTWTYERVAPMRELEFIQRFADSDGNTLAPAALGLPPDIPAEVRHVVAFRPAGEARTELTVTEYGYPSAQIVELSKAGVEQCPDKLAAVV
jgi:uncharacterized protein YndB with AHSA1/START domain